MGTLKALGTVGLLLLLTAVLTFFWGPETEDSSLWEAVPVAAWGLGGLLVSMAALGLVVDRRDQPRS